MNTQEIGLMLSNERVIKLTDGTIVQGCPCGKPPKGPGFVVRFEQGPRAGTEALCHEGCVKPA